jgi:hypothetical protein
LAPVRQERPAAGGRGPPSTVDRGAGATVAGADGAAETPGDGACVAMIGGGSTQRGPATGPPGSPSSSTPPVQAQIRVAATARVNALTTAVTCRILLRLTIAQYST